MPISQCSNMEKRLLIYYLAIALGGLLSAICGYHLGKRRGLPEKPLRVFLCLALFFGFFGAFLMGQLQNFIMSLTGLQYELSRMRIFGGLLFMPLFLYLPAKYLAGDFRLLTDIFAPGAFLILGCSKIGCAVYGCCYGIPWEHGVPSAFENHLCFPVQALEAVLCFALFVLMYMLYAKNRLKKGAAYPMG
ncbi:MAG: prolipoprotein diacylglyceryl transferase, partial [Clostridia bacterium]|nr:prolipoprotein diacylglyceryl transferase [Clostridia bacterium]